jgi:hypothetical protein
MKARNERILLLLIAATPVVASALSGLNSLFGIYSTISVGTAVLSAVLAGVVVVTFPLFLRSRWRRRRHLS